MQDSCCDWCLSSGRMGIKTGVLDKDRKLGNYMVRWWELEQQLFDVRPMKQGK